MNVLSLLTPKKEVQFLYDDFTVRQALEKMEFHKYGTIPVLERKSGKYLYSLTEGDFLWYLKERQLPFSELNKRPLAELKPSRLIDAVTISADINDLYLYAEKQNFVPVLDDLGVFIGIVTRKSIMRSWLLTHEEIKVKAIEKL